MRFLLTVCMSAIATALLRMLLPEKKFTKQMSLLIAATFVLAAVSSLSDAEFDLDASAYQYEDSAGYVSFSGEVNRSLQERVCRAMSDRLYALMNDNGLYPEEIHVIVNISGLYSISITQVKLVFPKGMDSAADAAAVLLSRELPGTINTQVIVKE